jgi:hypothetical protein
MLRQVQSQGDVHATNIHVSEQLRTVFQMFNSGKLPECGHAAKAAVTSRAANLRACLATVRDSERAAGPFDSGRRRLAAERIPRHLAVDLAAYLAAIDLSAPNAVEPQPMTAVEAKTFSGNRII